ncbi:MAG: DUF1572 domain-containing protein [Aureisphaera sp.]
MDENYLYSARKQFEYYKSLGERTFEQLNEEELLWQYNPESNSIAIMANHLWGNMLSRWTQFLSSDGEKTWRNRDLEFESVIQNREELMIKWNEGWQCLFNALDTISPADYDKKVLIRNQEHTIAEALNRQMMHYAYHIGQIVYVGRMIKAGEWNSLSIPKGSSQNFNKEKFSRGKHRGHFSDDIK